MNKSIADGIVVTDTHSDAAYDWYNSADRSKKDFEQFAQANGVTLFGDDRSFPDHDWADVVMSLFDAGRR